MKQAILGVVFDDLKKAKKYAELKPRVIIEYEFEGTTKYLVVSEKQIIHVAEEQKAAE
jgi:hypothetical protein